MRTFIFLIFISLFSIQAMSQQMPVQPVKDTTKNIIHIKPYWDASLAFGKGINSQFIANTENVWANNIAIRVSKNLSKYSLGIGYDAQTIALKNTEKNKLTSGQTRNFGNPQHSYYAFADRIWRGKKTDLYMGILLGYSSGKANNSDSSDDFTTFESSKGLMLGGHAGVIYKFNKNWNMFFELEPKMYSLVFDYTNKNGIQKTVDYRIKAFPIMIGVKYNFR